MKQELQDFLTTKIKTRAPSARSAISGASVVDENQTDPADGGPMVSETAGLYGPGSNPLPTDINQGQLGDCYFLSALSSLACVPYGQAYLKSIQYINASNPKQVCTKFTRSGTTTIIFSDLLISTEYEQFNPIDKDLWVELFVKAYALFREGADTYASLDNGNPSNVYSDMGLSLSAIIPTNAASVLPTVQKALAAGLGAVSILTPATVANSTYVTDHCYVIESTDGATQMVIRNPWGVDGGLPILTTVPASDITSANFDYVAIATIPTGTITLFELPVNEEVTVTTSLVDCADQPAPGAVTGPVWSISDPTVASLVPSGSNCTIKALGAAGATAVLSASGTLNGAPVYGCRQIVLVGT